MASVSVILPWSLGLILLWAETTTSQTLGGGLAPSKAADDTVRGIVSSLEGQIREKALATLLAQSGGNNIDNGLIQNAPLEVLAYTTQLVSGTNYFVKVKICNSYFHARIYKPLRGPLEFTNVIVATECGPIAYF